MAVHALPGVRPPSREPNAALIRVLRDALARAEAGELQSLVATGFTADGCRLSLWADQHDNVYEMHGAIGWLRAEYEYRHTAVLASERT